MRHQSVEIVDSVHNVTGRWSGVWTNRLAIPWRRLLEIAALAAILAVTLYYYAPGISMNDALDWWQADLDNLYAGAVLDDGGYVYPPPLAQIMGPFQLLPFWMFGALIVALNFGAGVYLIGPWLMAILAIGIFPPLTSEVMWGSLNIIVGAAIWYGMRWPALWVVPLLTKVTPLIGLLWFAVRGEWRSLGIAVGLTAAVMAVSALVAPNLWIEWIAWSVDSAGRANGNQWVPLMVRAPVAIGLVVWGARKDQPWAVPVAAVLVHTTLAWSLAAPALGYVMGRLPHPSR